MTDKHFERAIKVNELTQEMNLNITKAIELFMKNRAGDPDYLISVVFSLIEVLNINVLVGHAAGLFDNDDVEEINKKISVGLDKITNKKGKL